jgi:hypothetical protein
VPILRRLLRAPHELAADDVGCDECQVLPGARLPPPPGLGERATLELEPSHLLPTCVAWTSEATAARTHQAKPMIVTAHHVVFAATCLSFRAASRISVGRSPSRRSTVAAMSVAAAPAPARFEEDRTTRGLARPLGRGRDAAAPPAWAEALRAARSAARCRQGARCGRSQ